MLSGSPKFSRTKRRSAEITGWSVSDTELPEFVTIGWKIGLPFERDLICTLVTNVWLSWTLQGRGLAVERGDARRLHDVDAVVALHGFHEQEHLDLAQEGQAQRRSRARSRRSRRTVLMERVVATA